MSYTDLKDKVARYAHRTDLTPEMDDFTLHVEAIINKELRVMEQEVITETVFTAALTELPTDFIETRDLYFESNGSRISVEQLTPKQLNRYTSGSSGRPCFYAIHGGQIELRPDPDSETGTWSYYGKVPTLTANSTNDILDNYPLLYLAGMMTNVYAFLQDDGEQAKWSAIFSEQIATANKSAGTGRYTRPQVRTS